MSYPKGEQIMKITHLFAGLFLSTILGVGVSTALAVNNESKNAEEIIAANETYSLSGDFNNYSIFKFN